MSFAEPTRFKRNDGKAPQGGALPASYVTQKDGRFLGDGNHAFGLWFLPRKRQGRLGPMVQESDDFFDAPRRRYAALNRFIVDIAYSNWRFGFELARAKTFSDVLNLQAEYRRRLFNAFYRGEFRNWPVEAGEPASPVDQDERATVEPSPPQTERKTAKRPATGTAFKKPEPKSEQAAKQSAAKHASAVERKAEKIRAEPKEHRSPRRKADAGASKRPARQDQRGRRDEIQFARLDDSAVRFTKREAWRLRNGKWRRISVDKVLSDAIVLSKTRFDQLFPRAPQLPADAFLPDRK
jgi:hypothetical protein